jgi:hypothetical protein
LLVLGRIFNGYYDSGNLKKRFSTIDRSATSYTELTVHEKHDIALIKCSFANDKRYFYIFILFTIRAPPKLIHSFR